MSRTVQAKLNNGEVVDVNVPDGMTDDEAGTAFMRRYNENPSAYESPDQQLQATPQVGAPASNGLMNPNQPTTWDNLLDAVKGLASGVPKGAVNALGMVPAAGLGLRAAVEKLFGKPDDAQNARVRDQNDLAEMEKQLGGSFAPQTRLGQDAQAAGEGLAGTVLTGGRGLPEIAAGLISGAGGEEATRTTGNPFAGAVTAAAPFGALGAVRQFATSPAAAYHAASDALEKMHPGEIADLLANEANAGAAGIKPMVWQMAPPQSSLRNLGQGTALLPKADQTQEALRNLWGGQQGQHAAADQLAVHNLLNPSQLESNLRSTDRLRGANITTSPITSAGTHETGNIALGMDVAEKIAPHAVAPIAAMLGGMEFAKLGAVKRLLSGPTQKAADELASQTNLADYQKLAATNPKLAVYKNYLQGAFGMPIAQNLTPGADE